MSRWFRVYDDLVDDPKVQRLSAELFRALVNIWCLASKNNGKLPPIDEVAFKLRVKEDKAHSILRSLEIAGLIEGDEAGVHPHNWDSRQFKSDVSNERVKRHRERKCNVTSPVTETPPETETETETERTLANASVVPTVRGDETQAAFDAWNVFAGAIGLHKARTLNSVRRSALKQRLLECGGLSGWLEALEKIRHSQFCRGGGDKGWVIDFTALLQPKTFNALMEGRYDARKTPVKHSSFDRNAAHVTDVLDGGLASIRSQIAEAERREGIGGQDTETLPRLRQVHP